MVAVSVTQDWTGAIFFALLSLAAASSTLIFGVSSRSEGRSAWYASLPKSSLTPPAPVFAVVWTILYGLIAASGWLYWREGESEDGSTFYNFTLAFYIAQIVLNALWSILFFALRAIFLAFVDALLLLGASVVVLALYGVQSRWLPFGLFFPYVLWLLFALYLNGVILFSSYDADSRKTKRRRY